jgi:hypothetical protein
MSRYIYTFIRGDDKIEAEGYNLWSGAKNAGLTITDAPRLGVYYLQETPFEERERDVWISREYSGSDLWTVKQRYNK